MVWADVLIVWTMDFCFDKNVLFEAKETILKSFKKIIVEVNLEVMSEPNSRPGNTNFPFKKKNCCSI